MYAKIRALVKSPVFVSAVLIAVYLLTHLPSLTLLPVFADESIYIRWAQLIISDAHQYLFFPLNDGKTPLFIWQLVVSLQLLSDPLFAGRMVSLLAGLLQIFASMYLTQLLGGSKKAQLFTALSVIFLPFWYFHHRIALMDAWLTLWGTLTVAMIVRSFLVKKRSLVFAALAGITAALAVLTKVPAVLFFPALLPFIFLSQKKSVTEYYSELKSLFIFGAALCVFLLPLKFAPAFSQVFKRGSDFLFSFHDFFAGSWMQSLAQVPTYASYFISYASAGMLALLVYGCFVTFKHKRAFLLIILAGIFFLAPIALLGKVVYPRYLLPAMLFFTTAAALSFDEVLTRRMQITKLNLKSIAFGLFFLFVCTQYAATAFQFDIRSQIDADTIPFVAADRVQYLTEWSSGHGVKESVAYIQEQAQTHTVIVATEGFFGTLPDAVLMYLFQKDVHNIRVEGIGQPVRGIPDSFRTAAQGFDQVLLLVNSHRLDAKLSGARLVAQYCRPYNAPCLQLWDITATLQTPTE